MDDAAEEDGHYREDDGQHDGQDGEVWGGLVLQKREFFRQVFSNGYL